MHSLYQQIQKYVPLTSAESEKIASYFKSKSVAKKTILLHSGEICSFEAFIVKGCIKSYCIDRDGNEVIFSFATENWWVSDITSFQDRKPSRMWIETMEECELLMLDPAAKEALLHFFPKLERMFRLLVQNHLASYQERLFGNIALPAETRYENFLQKFPGLTNRIPQHQIAAYLGISLEFLSRLRKRKKQTK
jgi:CRP-like cAMP-binding protein